jgi:hypothetical protein
MARGEHAMLLALIPVFAGMTTSFLRPVCRVRSQDVAISTPANSFPVHLENPPYANFDPPS